MFEGAEEDSGDPGTPHQEEMSPIDRQGHPAGPVMQTTVQTQTKTPAGRTRDRAPHPSRASELPSQQPQPGLLRAQRGTLLPPGGRARPRGREQGPRGLQPPREAAEGGALLAHLC